MADLGTHMLTAAVEPMAFVSFTPRPLSPTDFGTQTMIPTGAAVVAEPTTGQIWPRSS